MGGARVMGSRTPAADFAEEEWLWLHLLVLCPGIHFICSKSHIAVNMQELI